VIIPNYGLEEAKMALFLTFDAFVL